MVETTIGPVAVGVQTATAGADDGAGPAGGAEAGQPGLPGDHAGVPGDLVQAVREDVETGGGRAVVRGLQAVGLFEGAVGLQHDQRGGFQAE